jgi:hypothetical protein
MFNMKNIYLYGVIPSYLLFFGCQIYYSYKSSNDLNKSSINDLNKSSINDLNKSSSNDLNKSSFNDLNKSTSNDIKNALIVIQLMKYNDSRDPIFLNNINKINKHIYNPNNSKKK